MKKKDPKKVVVGYTFVVCDLLHWGHIKFLEKCKEHCDYLVVGVYTDELTMTYKRKPLIPFERRIEMVKALKAVDEVRKVEHIDATPMLKQLVKEQYNVKVLMHAKQKQWSEIKGQEYIESIGGRLVLPEYTKGISSTAIIEEIKSRFEGGQVGTIGNKELTQPSHMNEISITKSKEQTPPTQIDTTTEPDITRVLHKERD